MTQQWISKAKNALILLVISEARGGVSLKNLIFALVFFSSLQVIFFY